MSKTKNPKETSADGPDDIDIKKYRMDLAEVRLIVDLKLKRDDGNAFQKGVLAKSLRGKLQNVIAAAIVEDKLSLPTLGIRIERAAVHVDERDQRY